MTTQAALAGNRPLYLRARDRIVERIRKGEWNVGDRIPSETDLARELRVSPGTMRKALDLMEVEQVVTRQQGVGTTVAARRPAEVCPMCRQAIGAHGKNGSG